jgi:small-conductance mechanosensitive channel
VVFAAALLLQVSAAVAQAEAPAQVTVPAQASAPAQLPTPAQAPPPVQLSDEQINLIVNAVTGAVLGQMKAGQQPAAPAPPRPAAAAVQSTEEDLVPYLRRQQTEFFDKFSRTLRAYPALAEHLGSIISRVDGGPRGLGPLAFLGYMAAIFFTSAALAYGAALAARRLLPGSEPKAGPASVGQTLRRAIASLIGLALFLAVTNYAHSTFSHGMGTQGMVAQWILTSGGHFAVFYTLFLIWFRPGEPAYRIVPLDGNDAKLAMRLFVVMQAVVALRSWISIPIASHQPSPVISAGLLVNNLLFVSSFFLAAIPARDAVRRWIENTAIGSGVSDFRRWLAANWLVIAGTSVLAIAAIHAYGAVKGHASVVAGLTRTVEAVEAMILICALAEFVGRRSDRADQAARRAIPKLPGLVSRMLRVLILMGAATYILKLWAVDALQVMTREQWSTFADFAIAPLVALFAGYLAVSYVNYLSARYLSTHPVTVTPANENGEIVAKSDGSSRLRTLIPIIRISANALIVVMITLLVLSQLGFNITPLLAGASVIGLAISFGSQALVKDIVSGVLFLAEDSFRVGEYIECGNSKGTVDGFTLRSIRLRHPDGQIYTVPFGQIGEIINYSRDWATVKFNMSLDRDADLDDVRRVTKTVAAALKADFKDRVLDPLKVQGVKDVTDNAIVVQFMLTSVPNDPGEIERVARSRLLKAFKEEGISLSQLPWFTTGAGRPAQAGT